MEILVIAICRRPLIHDPQRTEDTQENGTFQHCAVIIEPEVIRATDHDLQSVIGRQSVINRADVCFYLTALIVG
jgi:hypothetical protein